MQVVIDISEEIKDFVSGKTIVSDDTECDYLYELWKSVNNGIVLPEGHGNLIDVECVKKQFKGKEGDDFTAFHFYEVLDNAQTIIPATKGA